ncbi:macrolide family glycosyltransferase [Amycolatopsis sp. CA-126428]|uniref:macrolide family glycosyltransferase n=1 Tax=Amycolatopsis sp. CA-126428 TaxID=2073158 RepID=UPI000CCFD65D|nr:macrolide family glycosyltransferase [Amycolatopsis sp. CA-126428]
MNRRHFAFLPYPAYGHTTPVLPVLAELTARGHRVTCFTTPTFADRVAATGARPVGYSAELGTGPPSEYHTADEAAWLPTNLLSMTMAVAPGIDAAFAADPPDLLAYDTTLWAPGRFTAWRTGLPSVQMIPTFASNDSFSLNEDGASILGEGGSDVGPLDPAHPGLVEFDRLITGYAAEYGVDDASLVRLYEGRHEVNLVFVPKRFQPAAETFGAGYTFVGPPAGAAADHDWSPPDGKRVVLVTLGTTVNDRPEFFRDCLRAFAGLPWHFVLTLGGRLRIGDIGTPPPNVEVHQWIPHAAVLPHADLVVCQAGMGSVLESLYFGVPLVVVPHHTEQHLNTRRLLELGLATRLDRESVTPERLRAAVLGTASDAGIRARVAEMREHVRGAGGAPKAADVLEQRLTAPAPAGGLHPAAR